jgi:phosphoglycolate phosphatase-like HAD superfamily hydrolase
VWTPDKTVIFDVDGTLCDVRTVRHHVSRPGYKRFDLFHSEAVDCPPHAWVARMARRYYYSGWVVLIVTARKEKYRIPTSWWLALNNIPSHALYMRPNSSYEKDYDLKKKILAGIRKEGFEPSIAFDDKPNVIKVWQEEGIRTVVVPGWEEPTPSYSYWSPNLTDKKPLVAVPEQEETDWDWFDSQFDYVG